MSNRWRPEARLAERLYKVARPYLVSLSSRPALHTPDDSVREALRDGDWGGAVIRMLYLGWVPEPDLREVIRRVWVVNGIDPEVGAALDFSAWVVREQQASSTQP